MLTFKLFIRELEDSIIPASGFPTIGKPSKSLLIPAYRPKFIAELPLERWKFHNSGLILEVSKNIFSFVDISSLLPEFKIPPKILLPTK